MRNRTEARQTGGKASRHRYAPCLRCGFVLAIFLAGCEAPLDLSGVQAERAQAVQRGDLFQAVTRHQDTVLAVGGMGTVLLSSDSGQSWQRSSLPGAPFLVDAAVCPDARFYALEKTDGLWSLGPNGEWLRQELPEMTEPQAMTCDHSNTLWITGGFSTILHSGDRGRSWESWSLDEDLYLTTIQFVNAAHGFATGEFGSVLTSDDGGASWNRAEDLPGSFYPQDAWFADPSTGWVVGLNGTIWRTDTGGQSWREVESGVSTPLYGIHGSAESLVAVGDNTTILYWRPGDRSWRPLNETKKSLTYLRGVADVGDGRFIVAGGGTLFSARLPQRDAAAQQEAR